MGKRRGRLSCWSREQFPALRGRRRMSTKLDQIMEKAKSNPKLRFTSLAHLLTPEFLAETWKQMNRRGASGVDGETMKEFEQDLDTRVQQLCERLKQGPIRLHRYAVWRYRRVLARQVRGRSEFRLPKTACCNERLRGCWRQCSRRIFWNARMDFGLDAILTVPLGHCGRSSSRRRLETCSRRTSGATLTTSSMIGCRRWLLIELQTRSSCA